ncbi:MAG TPA: elongation factor P [Spirochaetia bacterium]|nr:elongation factor P [Spirochaetia bacterium]
MIKAGAISKGMCLLMKDEPYLVVEREFVNPGKGSAFVRLRLKGLRNGKGLQETMKTNDSVEEADVYERDAQFLFADAQSYHFMDSESFEQFEVDAEGLENKRLFMKETETYKLIMWEGTAIDIELPTKVVYTVVDAPDAIKGDTVTGATKMVKLETGLEVKVPIFIKQGERVLVNTESGDYVERVNS